MKNYYYTNDRQINIKASGKLPKNWREIKPERESEEILTMTLYALSLRIARNFPFFETSSFVKKPKTAQLFALVE